ncbi:MAG TPA: NAD(P)H-binding protein [Jatrophihabitans sp.]|uniref:NAD(P)H-binding protein n=1 Tax=Jatrophihabitans sp. TaxID=1932789 RepID=UPI002E09DE88|nr:NAD(P)H-binding protein [Jatrophihabitans sp.]
MSRLPSPAARPVLVAGATGFIGRRLVPALIDAGHDVQAMTRRPDRYDGPGTAVGADIDDPDALFAALDGCAAAYYLVHSLDRGDFVARDAAAAEAFGLAAASAGVQRIVYLGGLGDEQDDLSPHLRSRQEVEGLLATGGVPVTTLRAGIVIGHGGASWEMIRSVVERIPALAVPRWALTRTQPIALADVVRYLVGVLDLDDQQSHTFDIGGAEVLRYVDVLSRVSALEGRPSIVVPVPVPSTRLAALLAGQALPLITGVDGRTIRSLIASMKNEVVVRDDSIRRVVPFEPMGYDEAVLAALGERARARRAS